MKLIETNDELIKTIDSLKDKGKKIALVPTMGALHRGHLSLIKIASEVSDITLATIFVNPTQFNQESDLKAYPRTLKKDLEILKENGCDLVFAPSESEIYGENFQSEVVVKKLTKPLEGAFRPGHFSGVTTIVNILFNLTKADFAVFGEKDFQQLRVIEQMVSDLKIPIKIIRAPLIREESGIALSSRNTLLSENEKNEALKISKALLKAKELFDSGSSDVQKIKEVINLELSKSSILKLDYLEITDANLEGVTEKINSGNRVLIAAYCGSVRLIDNVEF